MKKPTPTTEDKVNLRILECLATHGRMPYAKVAEKLSLSPNAVRDRILSMERRGVILSYHAIPDQKAIGHGHHVLAMMHPGPRVESALQAAVADPAVLEVYESSGRFGLVVEIAGRGPDHVDEILDRVFYAHGYELAESVPLGASVRHYKVPVREEPLVLEVAA